jgi:hypothetical protein
MPGRRGAARNTAIAVQDSMVETYGAISVVVLRERF